jgi:hypothetical protein
MATTKATEIRKANEVRCVFVSVWDGDVTLRSRAIYHRHDHSVEVLETHDVDGLEHLDREYVEMPDGEELRVCPECHEYVLKPVMVEGVGKSLTQDYECPSPTCGNKA